MSLVTVMLVAPTLLLAQGYAAVYLAYLWAPALAALVGRLVDRRGTSAAAEASGPSGAERSFVILVSAHNESAVIGALLASLGRQEYPAEKWQVHVVANNCTDSTAALVRGSGVAACHERTGGDLATKGAALAWLWERLRSDVTDADTVLILDADNVVPPTFLAEMSRAFAAGYRVVQSARCAKNADDSWTSQLDAISEALWNRLDQAGRMRLGLSASIAGSGMAFERTVFEWLIDEGGPGLLEDIEWQARLALAGIRVAYAERARVYDEKTSRVDQLGRQRKRWVAGVAVAARRYALPLAVAGLRTGSPARLVAAFAVSKPPRSLLLAGIGLLAATGWLLPGISCLLPWPIWAAALASFGAYVLLGMALDSARPEAYLALLAAPGFAATMIGASVLGALQATRQRWVPTAHGRNVALDELQVR
jgi:cellulose synthase/poly-beta-1,6-N-acetylglucosamine synthase-like glycosyltransferase